jgi:hypothetical protein
MVCCSTLNGLSILVLPLQEAAASSRPAVAVRGSPAQARRGSGRSCWREGQGRAGGGGGHIAWQQQAIRGRCDAPASLTLWLGCYKTSLPPWLLSQRCLPRLPVC